MAVAGVSHITLSSPDVRRAERFYLEVLGFESVARWPTGAYLSAGDLWLALVDGPAESRSDEYSHIALHVDAHDFDEVEARIVAAGTESWQDNWTEGRSRYFTDPDGHRLEIHATTFAARIESARAEPWPGLTLNDDADHLARPALSVSDPRKPRRLHCPPVGVYVVVVDDGERVLFLRHPDTGILEVPSGALEPGEDPRATANRELAEEAGPIEIGPLHCCAAFNVEYHRQLPPLLSIGFVGRHLGGFPVAGDDKAGWEACWLQPSETSPDALHTPGDRSLLEDAIRTLRGQTR